MDSGFKFRDYDKDKDMSLISNSWLLSALDRSLLNEIKGALIKSTYTVAIHNAIDRSKLILVCLADMPEEVVAWIAYEKFPKQVIHYIYVKKHFRSHGFGKSLFEEVMNLYDDNRKCYVSHCAPASEDFIVDNELIYSPRLFWDKHTMQEINRKLCEAVKGGFDGNQKATAY